jgi:hypothetical protein
MPKTFIITELRENEKGEKFEVETKIQCDSLKALIDYLAENKHVTWGGKLGIRRSH